MNVNDMPCIHKHILSIFALKPMFKSRKMKNLLLCSLWGLFGLLLYTGSVHAQNNITSPMKDVNNVIDNTLDSLNKARTARPVAGASRKGNNPVLFLVGNSTMRTGTLGNGNNGQWGWGYYAGDFFDTDKITVENPLWEELVAAPFILVFGPMYLKVFVRAIG
jgi:hypothetical protein